MDTDETTTTPKQGKPLVAILPKIKHEYLNNTKAALYMSTNEDLLGNQIELITIPKKDICISINLTTDSNIKLSNPNITPFDAAVLDAIYTLATHKCMAFTAEMAARAMTGNMDGRISPQRVGAITRAINKLALIRIKIDCTEEFRYQKFIAKDATYEQTSYVLPVDEVEVTTGNRKKMRGFVLNKIPIQYTYAELVHQILRVPIELLQTTGGLSDTDDLIVLKRGLIRRIELMRNEHNNMNSRFIRYQREDPETHKEAGFFHSLGFKEEDFTERSWKNKRLQLHQNICAILDQYKKNHYISDYHTIVEHQRIIGVEIIIDDSIVLKQGLIRRIELMRSEHNNMTSRIIRYQCEDPETHKEAGFFHSLGFKEEDFTERRWKNKRSQLHQNICTILNQFKKNHYISDYHTIVEHQRIIGVEITLPLQEAATHN